MKNAFPVLPLAFSVAILLAGVPCARAGVVFSENFQTQTAGAAPSGAIVVAPVGKAIVVNSSTAIPDPFGIPGNQSLMIEKTVAGAPAVPRVSWSIPEIRTGLISFDSYTVFDAGAGLDKTLMNFFAYDGSLTAIGPRFWVNADGTVTIGDGATTRVTGSIWTHNTTHSVQLEIFDDYTYSLTLDGSLIGWTSGGTTKTRFGFNHSPVGGLNVDMFQFAVADTARVGSRFFIDNIQVIPEPGSMVLLGVGAMAGLIIARKRRIIL